MKWLRKNWIEALMILAVIGALWYITRASERCAQRGGKVVQAVAVGGYACVQEIKP